MGNVGSYSITKLTRQFLTVALYSCGFSLILGFIIGFGCFTPLGKPFRPVVDKVAMVFRAFPDVAMVRFIVPLMGLGVWPSVVALTTHGILPIIFAVTSGVDNIDKGLLNAAKGMGMTRGQIMTRVQFPLALPVIISGLRVSLISCIGGATIATASGGEGLGLLLGVGLETYNVVLIMECAVLICLMSLIVDRLLRRVETVLTHGV